MFKWLTKLFSSEEPLVLTKEMEVKETPKKKSVTKSKAPAKKKAATKIVAKKKATKK
jgi:hypothetical protein|tara:strand:- start:17492 stop:17662 length:171 start_codon:yes stop_codon:yes gene_type:complete